MRTVGHEQKPLNVKLDSSSFDLSSYGIIDLSRNLMLLRILFFEVQEETILTNISISLGAINTVANDNDTFPSTTYLLRGDTISQFYFTGSSLTPGIYRIVISYKQTCHQETSIEFDLEVKSTLIEDILLIPSYQRSQLPLCDTSFHNQSEDRFMIMNKIFPILLAITILGASGYLFHLLSSRKN